MEWGGRSLFFLAGALLFIPAGLAPWAAWTDLAGLILGAMIVFWDIEAAKRLKSSAPA